MSDFTELSKKVIKIARGEDKKKPSPYDTKATVNRVDYENRKAYVRFYGGVDETPVDLTVNCERGDTVQVRVGGGRAWIVGNQTAPPTDDKAVNILNHTVNNLRNQFNKTKEELEEEIEEFEPGGEIERIATEYILSTSNTEVIPYDDMEWSEELPEWVPSPRTYYWTRIVIYYTDGTVVEQDPILDANAQISAEADFAISSENNHFWHDSSGAWVTEVDQEDYISDPTQGGYANRVTNAGILQTYNGNLLTAWTGSGVSFYDGSGSTAATSKMLAAFYSSGITFDTTTPFTIGNTNSYIKWINTGTELSPNWKLQINADTIQFGSDSTNISDVVNPYEIETSVESIVANTDAGTTTPTSITVYFKKAGSFTSGYLYVENSTNGTSWSQHYGPSQSASFTVPLSSSSSFKFYRFSWYEESAMTNLKNSKTIPVIATGEEGIGIDDTTITYATSSSYSTPPSSGWQSTPPYVSQGYYLWTKTIFSYSDGTSSDPVYSVARQGVNGQNGTDVTSQYVTYITAANGVVVRHAGNDNSYPYLMCNASGVYNYYSDTYFSKMDSSGLKVYAGSSTNPKAVFNSSGATIYSGTDYSYPVATFGTTTTIGKTNGSHFIFGSDKIECYEEQSAGTLSGYIQATWEAGGGKGITMCSDTGARSMVIDTITGSTTDDCMSGINYYYNGVGTYGITVYPNAVSITGHDGAEAIGVSYNGATAGNGVQVTIDGVLMNSYCYTTSAVSSGKNVVINSNWTFRNGTASSKRYKTDIGEITESYLLPEKLYNLPVVQFKFKPGYLDEEDELYDKYVPGLIAEDVEKYYPRAATHLDGYTENWDERRLLPPMLALIQDQKKMIDDLEERVSALEGGLQ